MRLRLGIIRNRLWTLEYYSRASWAKEDVRRAWLFLCHWPKYGDYWLRICGITISGRKGLAEHYRLEREATQALKESHD